MKRIALCLLTASFVAAASITSFAGQWKTGAGENANQWWYDNEDGTWASNGWKWIDGNGDGTAECYCFDSSGWLYTNTVTPDGYTVNENGAWIENGVIQTQMTNKSIVKEKYAKMLGANVEDIQRTYGQGETAYSTYSNSTRIIYDDFQITYKNNTGIVFSVLGTASEICNFGDKTDITKDDVANALGQEGERFTTFTYTWLDCGIPNGGLEYIFGDIEIYLRNQ